MKLLLAFSIWAILSKLSFWIGVIFSSFKLNFIFDISFSSKLKAFAISENGAIPLFKEIFNSFPEQEILDEMNFNE
jgi:hypothetical protein